MPYKKSLDEMIELLKPGMKIYKKGSQFIIKSHISNDKSKTVKLQGLYDSEEKDYSFMTLYKNELIDDDGNIFEKIDNVNNSFNQNNYNSQSNLNSQNLNRLFEQLNQNKDESSEEILNNYSELKRFFFRYDSSNRCEFYQYTAAENAIGIIKSGFIMSRDSAIGNIKYDNIEMNDTTNSVMNSNYSTRIEKYARFYFNVRNKTTYSMKKNFESKHTFGIIFAIEYSSIWHNQKVFVTPISAHYSTNSDFEWTGNNCKDISNKINLKNLKTKSFDFKKTFEEYDREENNDYQMAEILFYDKISIDYVSHIYFASQNDLNTFLSKLNDAERNKIISKCEINPYLHWRL